MTRSSVLATGPQAWGIPAAGHDQAIASSHLRCAGFGMRDHEAPDPDPVVKAELNLLRERHLRLFQHAVPVMEMLFEQIQHTQSMVVLTNDSGMILHSLGNDDFLARAEKIALAPGVCWDESRKGTNAVGTAIHERSPTVVHANEHFVKANQFLTCSASPIFDPRGNLLGILDVSGDHRSYHPHTLGLVQLSARMIENQWLFDNHADQIRLRFHARLDCIGTLTEGVVAVARDGRLIAANRSALDQLGMSAAQLSMHSLISVFGTTLGALADRFRGLCADPISFELPNGRKVFARAEGEWGSIFSIRRQDMAQAFQDTVVARLASASQPASSKKDGIKPSRAVEALREKPSMPDSAPTHTRQSALAALDTGDPQMHAVIEKVARVLDRDIPILLLGETGTGKELLAAAIHHDSRRASGPFVAVNCASIPESLIESELFGYEEGAFTGARRKGAIGKIQLADKGTLFLDEIGDMPLGLQARLLRVLQERVVMPLGSNRAIPVDIAVVCATHRHLRELMEAKLFRDDLYYRLNGISLRLPSLKQRTDLPLLVQKILAELSPVAPFRVSAELMEMFQNFRWRGNLRQLSNILRAGIVMAGDNGMIRSSHMPEDFLEEIHGRVQPTGLSMNIDASLDSDRTDPVRLGEAPRTLLDVEVETIRKVLEQFKGNISLASRQLGISRNTIYRKLHWSKPPGA